MKIEHLKVNHVEKPLGFAMDRPVFSYIVTESTGKKQTAARIRIALDENMEQLVYDSGRREDICSLAFPVDLPLQPRTRYYWNVACWAEDGDHGLSETSWFETGKREEPWQGQWIRAPFQICDHSSHSGQTLYIYACKLPFRFRNLSNRVELRRKQPPLRN